MASLTIREPETYSVKRNAHCPNSSFPVLVYRNVLPTPVEEESTSEFLQRNKWEKKVEIVLTFRFASSQLNRLQGTWGAITTKHFHPNTHECYGAHSPVSLSIHVSFPIPGCPLPLSP